MGPDERVERSRATEHRVHAIVRPDAWASPGNSKAYDDGGLNVCGIAGWVGYDRDLTNPQALEALVSMTKSMAPRGPDEEGHWVGGHAALGHRRLAVIDVEGGVQPMTVDTPEGTIVLLYSGECYNFMELRDELRGRGHTFRTCSDTEVVLRGFLEWGARCAEHFNGMYALAIWDARDEKLHLIRDRFGVKPLYYYPTPDGVLFGSEPKAILANPLARSVVDLEGLREAFVFSRTPGHAIWSGMREVKPGGVVTVDRDGLRERTYWSLQARPHLDDLETTVGTVRELLGDIVRLQLVSDVPWCMLLSGGLDSSALTALAHGASGGKPIRTFAVDFVHQAEQFVPEVGAPSLDAPFVRAVAKHVGSDHRDIIFAHAMLADPHIREACIRARDLPNGFGDRDLSLYLLFRSIRGHSTVALSGESGDEVFGGYPSFHMPKAVQADTFPWLTIFPIRPAELLDPRFQAALDLEHYVHDRYVEALAEVPVLEGEGEVERRMREVCYLHLTRLLPVMLERKDRLSMALGVEVRVPYCDYRLVEYVFNIPWRMKAFDGREKSILRAAVRELLPASVIGRQKSGYPSTHEALYVKALQNQVGERLRSKHRVVDFYDRQQVTEAIQVDPVAISRPQRAGLERLLDFAVWLDIRNPSLDLPS